MRTALVAGAVAAVLLGLFILAHALDVPLLSDERPVLGPAGAAAAVSGVALLVSDVVLPVPSSGVMLANGVVFGSVAGAALSLAGSLGAAGLGWWIGQRGARLLDRLVAPSERARTAALVAEHGALAVLLSRPIPVLSETVTLMAGAVGMPLPRLLTFALLGSVPPAVGYGIAGAAAGRSEATVPIFLALFVLSALVWLLGRRRSIRSDRNVFESRS